MTEAQADHFRLAELAASLGLHDHLCLIYDTPEEQFAAALPYLRKGLERRERCLYVADGAAASAILDALHTGGTDIDRHLREGALTIVDKNEVYLKAGRFDPQAVLGFWMEAVKRAKADGFQGLRVLAEMTWAPGRRDIPGELIEY